MIRPWLARHHAGPDGEQVIVRRAARVRDPADVRRLRVLRIGTQRRRVVVVGEARQHFHAVGLERHAEDATCIMAIFGSFCTLAGPNGGVPSGGCAGSLK